MTILTILPLIFWVILWVYWFVSAFRAKKSVHMGSWWLKAFGIRLVLLLIVIFAFFAGRGGVFVGLLSRFSNEPSMMFPAGVLLFMSIIGVILCAAGVSFAIWARVDLGKNWGMPMTLREEPELVTSGPYKFVRHPIYSGFFIAMFGTALTDGPTWLLILILFGIYFIYSAKTEEKNMMKQFPDQYPEYMKRTKMLIPFIL